MTQYMLCHMLEVLRDIWAVLVKDLTIELRTREILYSMVLFSLLVVVVFAFAFLAEPGTGPLVAPGILWVALVFSGTLGLLRSSGREQDGQCIQALVMSPASRAGLFFGKVLANASFMVGTEFLLVPLVAILFRLDLGPRLWWFVLVLGLGTVGFATLGTLFSIMLLNTRLREVLLPMVFYPIVTPALIAGVKATTALLADDGAGAFTWIKVLVAFDALYLTLGAWTFGWTMGE